jgi:REP element-mobilizing transposase RayT
MSQQSLPTEKPSRRNIRLKDYDYSQAGWYFATICTKDKACLLGQVEKSEMLLSDIGRTAEEHLAGISKHFPFVSVDEYVVMPNHIHTIIVIQSVGAAFMPPAETPSNPLTDPTRPSLSFIIQQYKSGVKRWCSANGFGHFGWQRGFYEHVIRNEDDLHNIREYIINNPMRWIEDEEYIK